MTQRFLLKIPIWKTLVLKNFNSIRASELGFKIMLPDYDLLFLLDVAIIIREYW